MPGSLANLFENQIENRKSPTWLDEGPGFSRTRFAGANSPEPSFRGLHGVGISQVTDFTAGGFPPRQRCIDADSENGRDLCQRMPLNFLQQKHVAISLGQFEGSQYGALESAGLVHS
jgi:hypothetical protein